MCGGATLLSSPRCATAPASQYSPQTAAPWVRFSNRTHIASLWSRLGRVEVFQPIPPPNGKSPEGPHTHVLPKLLAHGRTHAATEPLPAGWIPCAHLYPPHPVRDEFGRRRPFHLERHLAFQDLLISYGDPQLVALKRRVTESIMAGHGPSAISVTGNRFARGTVRVALRQLREFDKSSGALAAWLSAHDRFEPAEAEEPTEGNH